MDLQLTTVLDDNRAYLEAGSHPGPRTPKPARHLVIVTCMDARLDLFGALGLAVGDAHILRNAGGRVSDDVIRSLVVSSHLLGTREAGVVHHTGCGMEGLTDEQIAERTGVTGLSFQGFPELEASVRDDVDAIRACPHLPEGFATWGATYDVDTGALRVVVPPAPA